MVIQTAESASTRESTEIVVKILDSTYANYNLDKVAVESYQYPYVYLDAII